MLLFNQEKEKLISPNRMCGTNGSSTQFGIDKKVLERPHMVTHLIYLGVMMIVLYSVEE